jgi:hypothetical protein
MKEREAMGDGCRDEVKRERARKGNQEKWRDRVEPWDVSCVNRRRLKLETREAGTGNPELIFLVLAIAYILSHLPIHQYWHLGNTPHNFWNELVVVAL